MLENFYFGLSFLKAFFSLNEGVAKTDKRWGLVNIVASSFILVLFPFPEVISRLKAAEC